jgi:hypothetical protein
MPSASLTCAVTAYSLLRLRLLLQVGRRRQGCTGQGSKGVMLVARAHVCLLTAAAVCPFISLGPFPWQMLLWRCTPPAQTPSLAQPTWWWRLSTRC